jgi:hypothetical protein
MLVPSVLCDVISAVTEFMVRLLHSTEVCMSCMQRCVTSPVQRQSSWLDGVGLCRPWFGPAALCDVTSAATEFMVR